MTPARPPSAKTWLFSSASAILLSQVATAAHAQAVAAPSASAYAEASAAAASDAPIATAPRGTATPIAGWTAAADGFSAMKSGQFTTAAGRFVAALDSGDLTVDQKRAVTLALSDTLVQAGEPVHAAGVLSTLAPDTYDVTSRLAYALDAAGKRAEAASAYKSAAAEAPGANERVQMSKGRVFALASLDRRADALAEIGPLAGARDLTSGDAVNLAYLAVKFGDDRLALRLFDRADAAKPLSSEVALDAAYAARRLKQDEPAVRYFRQSLASAVVRPTLEAEQTRYQVRREISDLSRRFGFQVAAFYDQNDNLVGRVPGAARGDLQIGGEAVYRPFGYNGGQTVGGLRPGLRDRGLPAGRPHRRGHRPGLGRRAGETVHPAELRHRGEPPGPDRQGLDRRLGGPHRLFRHPRPGPAAGPHQLAHGPRPTPTPRA